MVGNTKEKTQTTLAGLLEVMKDPYWANQGNFLTIFRDARIYVRQAKELIEGKAPDPKQ